MSFIAELKRRNVIRAAGLYLVGAWFAFVMDVDLKHYRDGETHQRAIARFLGVDADAKAVLARGMGDPAQRAAALQSLDHAPANAEIRADSLSYAFYLIALDQSDRALNQLDAYAIRRDRYFGMFLWDRCFDPLRNTPRFKAMLAKVGLPCQTPAGAVP